jgi:hypothetical protein
VAQSLLNAERRGTKPWRRGGLDGNGGEACRTWSGVAFKYESAQRVSRHRAPSAVPFKGDALYTANTGLLPGHALAVSQCGDRPGLPGAATDSSAMPCSVLYDGVHSTSGEHRRSGYALFGGNETDRTRHLAAKRSLRLLREASRDI